MLVLPMEKYNVESGGSYVRDEGKIDDPIMEQSKWWNKNFFSPARDVQNQSKSENQSHVMKYNNPMNFLKFHPYIREHCETASKIPQFIPYLPLRSASNSEPVDRPEAIQSLPSINFNSFFQADQKQSETKLEKEMKSESMKSEKTLPKTAVPEKSYEKRDSDSDKMASRSATRSKDSLKHSCNQDKGKSFFI